MLALHTHFRKSNEPIHNVNVSQFRILNTKHIITPTPSLLTLDITWLIIHIKRHTIRPEICLIYVAQESLLSAHLLLNIVRRIQTAPSLFPSLSLLSFSSSKSSSSSCSSLQSLRVPVTSCMRYFCFLTAYLIASSTLKFLLSVIFIFVDKICLCTLPCPSFLFSSILAT